MSHLVPEIGINKTSIVTTRLSYYVGIKIITTFLKTNVGVILAFVRVYVLYSETLRKLYCVLREKTIFTSYLVFLIIFNNTRYTAVREKTRTMKIHKRMNHGWIKYLPSIVCDKIQFIIIRYFANLANALRCSPNGITDSLQLTFQISTSKREHVSDELTVLTVYISILEHNSSSELKRI